MKHCFSKTRIFALLFAAVWSTTAIAAPKDRVETYFFSNSLAHHLSETEDRTNIVQWLAMLANAKRVQFAADGQWGFIRNFVDTLPPRPNWSFPDVEPAWNSRIQSFGASGINAIVLTPANFIQYQSPDRPYDGENHLNESPVEASQRLLTWVARELPDAPVYIYEGWADMAGIAEDFPPSLDDLAKYHAFNQADYHDWYVTYRDMLADSLPDSDVRLIPVASVLSDLLSSEPLSAMTAEDVYSDNAPHGRPSLYFLAAMITFSALYETAPPDFLLLPDDLHPALRDNYSEIAERVWQAIQPTLPAQDQAMVDSDAVETTASNNTQTNTSPALPATPPATEPKPELEPTAETSTVVTQTAPISEPAVQAADTTQPSSPTPQATTSVSASDVPALAMGLNGIADWSTQHPFINIMKTARPWVGHLPNQWGGMDDKMLRDEGYLDENGWPVSIPENVSKLESFVLSDQPEEDTYLPGTYEVRYQGKGKLRIGGRAKQVNLRDGAGTFDYTPGDGLVSIAISETDPDDPIRDIAIFKTEHRDLYEAGALFNPTWLDHIEDLRSLRFMDWMQTNGSTITTWDDRPKMDDFTWTTGVPLEVMIALSNQIGADPWFNMPHMSDDAYVKQFAQVVKATLDPRLKAYVEYSNEVWNFIFTQAVYSRDQGEKLWGKSETGWMEYYGLRAAQVMKIWADIYGTDADDRLVRVAATHSGWQGLEEYVLYSNRVKKELGQHSQEFFDAYAVTGYFGYEMGGEEYTDRMKKWLDDSQAIAKAEGEKQGLKRVFLDQHMQNHGFDTAFAPVASALKQGSLKELIEITFPYHAKAAERAGLDLVMYEGGTHVAGHGESVNDDRMTAFFKAFNYSPEMADIYTTLLKGWTDAGGKLFNAFVDVAPASQWGSWGSLRYLTDENPRWDALRAFNARGDGGWQNRTPDDFANGLRLTGTAAADTLTGTPEEDYLTGGTGDDTIIPGGGVDFVHGGDGEDLLVLDGTLGDFTLTRTQHGLSAVSATQNVSMVSIELLEFSGDGLLIRAPTGG